uniref:Uncharacterized protein LOC105047737 isoform X1 n=1 Tax=Elaeis guineensis var. tenera TaxID=51953 RepID=A0A8N4F0N1_ELAGV|nr:uncharacterized protein LOC105047737 isoform X1 [Elaeis guineensis]
MPRMEDILNLPVQDPPLFEFSAANLNWIKVDGGRQGGDDIALIPFSRVDDFVKGESSNAECPASFRIESRRKRSEGTVTKPRIDAYIEYTLYWCSYGPEDYRRSESSNSDCPNNKPLSGKGSRPGRRHMMRGCLCHFTVKRLYGRPLLALIIYNQQNHVDKTGAPCHGLLDMDAVGTRAMYAPWISDGLRQKIICMLYVGMSLDNIIQHHVEMVERHGGPRNRDDFLTRNDVRNIERVILHSTYKLHADDALSLDMWVQRHQKYVFFFRGNCEMEPFVLGIQTEWQLQQMLHYGHNGCVALHSSFGLKKLRHPLHTLLVFDSCQNAIPVAWVINSSFDGPYIHNWIDALVERARAKHHRWRPNSFLVDDPSPDVFIIRETFQCQVFLCLWHVRRAWFKGLLKKCFNFDVQKEIFRLLGHILYCPKSGQNVMDIIEEFMQIFIDQHEFMEYFKKRWLTRIDMWIAAVGTLPVSKQELDAAIESYHLKLKSKLLSDVHANSWHRVDWLVHTLTTEFHSIYWFHKYTEECGPLRNHMEEFLPTNSWYRALQIPDLDVLLDEEDLHPSKVVSQSDRSLAYTIWNPGSEFSICDCPWSRMGNLCEHVIKVGIFCRNQQHHLKGLEDLSNGALLQPSSALDASAFFHENISPQTSMPREQILGTRRQRTLSRQLNNGGLQLDFLGRNTCKYSGSNW